MNLQAARHPLAGTSVVNCCYQDFAMSTGCWRIKPSEIERTLRSVRSVGLQVRCVELAADGTVKITLNEAKSGELNVETPEQLRKLL